MFVLVVFFFDLACATCVDLCSNVTNPVVCSKKGGHCGKGIPGDFDYFVFSQLWLPAYCDALSRDFDPTVSHAPGARCVYKPPRRFGIHGLWPNYVGGFPFCCNKSVEPINYDDVRPNIGAMMRFWSDPADATSNDTVCGLWNHELLKHGTCVALDDPRHFFPMALQVNDRLQSAMTGVSQLTQNGQTAVSVAALRSLFNNTRIQLACDATVAAGTKSTQLLELRTCFDVDRATGDVVGKPIDCPPLTNTKTMIPCSGKTVTLI